MRLLLISIVLIALQYHTPESIESERPLTPENYLLGKVDAAKDSNFVLVPHHLSSKAIYLEKETLKAFLKMQEAAQMDGVQLTVISGFRSFSHQKRIWEAKWTGQRKVNGKNLNTSITDPVKRAKKILEFSSMPGTSRHHWGTDIDIYSLNNQAFTYGKGYAIYTWLIQNASKYGFCQVYSEKGINRPNGYEEEKWHWSYMPKSLVYLSDFKQLINYNKIKGFKGSETAQEVKAIEHYVLGINTSCRH
jgi:hypothetical protein